MKVGCKNFSASVDDPGLRMCHLHEDGDDLDDVFFSKPVFVVLGGGCLFDDFFFMDEKPLLQKVGILPLRASAFGDVKMPMSNVLQRLDFFLFVF